MRHRLHLRAMTTLALVVVSMLLSSGQGEELCSIPPVTYPTAKTQYPKLVPALEALEARGIATWYSDREANGDYRATATQLVEACDPDTRLTVVVYGLPNKDCEAGFSTVGSTVHNASDYATFIDELAQRVGSRKVLYVLEPDAVGLIANGKCAEKAGYEPNLNYAIKTLSANANAEIYLDVGFWTLSTLEAATEVAEIVARLARAGRIKGIALNTSNYQSIELISERCLTFQTAYNDKDLHCIIDTSRNYVTPSSAEWCNLQGAGIGHEPTNDTGLAHIDYFVWVKPPGDSDGTCDEGRTAEATLGPEAGVFFAEYFALLWNNGILVQEEGFPALTKSSSVSVSAGVIVMLIVLALAVVAVVVLLVRRRRRQGSLKSATAAQSSAPRESYVAMEVAVPHVGLRSISARSSQATHPPVDRDDQGEGDDGDDKRISLPIA